MASVTFYHSSGRMTHFYTFSLYNFLVLFTVRKKNARTLISLVEDGIYDYYDLETAGW